MTIEELEMIRQYYGAIMCIAEHSKNCDKDLASILEDLNAYLEVYIKAALYKKYIGEH